MHYTVLLRLTVVKKQRSKSCRLATLGSCKKSKTSTVEFVSLKQTTTIARVVEMAFTMSALRSAIRVPSVTTRCAESADTRAVTVARFFATPLCARAGATTGIALIAHKSARSAVPSSATTVATTGSGPWRLTATSVGHCSEQGAHEPSRACARRRAAWRAAGCYKAT